jgi:predicted DNA-binding transcriptional regulator AlpA
MRSNRRPAADRPAEVRTLPTFERLWTIHDVSAFLAVPVGTLYQWRHRELGPPAIRLGKHLRYDPTKVLAWVDEQAA